MEQSFDLGDFLRLIFKKLKVPLILTVIFLILGLILGIFFANKNEYTVSIPVCINLKNPENADPSAFTTLIGYIKDSVSSNYFYVNVSNMFLRKLEPAEIKELFNSANPSVKDVKDSFTVSTNGNMLIFEIVSKNKDLCLKTATMLSNFVKTFVLENVTVANVELLSPALYETFINDKFTNVIKYAILGGALGLILGVLWVFLFDVVNNKVHDRQDLLKFGLKILGQINTKGESDAKL